jgi:hypothetical protein
MTTFHFDPHLLLDFSGIPIDLATTSIFHHTSYKRHWAFHFDPTIVGYY